MKIYLAGKWADRNGSMGEKRDSLLEAGHTITHDWMTFEVPTRDDAHRAVMAVKDMEGVRAADAVVFVMDDPLYSYRGSFTELGGALMARKPICMVSAKRDDCKFKVNVFWHHPDISQVSDWDTALRWLAALQDIIK
jgi:nucleoside 2-deoxyribosyltransferase